MLYRRRVYCSRCRKWFWRDEALGYCPYCGNSVRTKPHSFHSKKRYIKTKVWTLDEAIKLYHHYLKNGCDKEEALELVEARTGYRIEPELIKVKAV